MEDKNLPEGWKVASYLGWMEDKNGGLQGEVKGDELEEGGGGRTGWKCKGLNWWAGVRSKMGHRDGASKNLRYLSRIGNKKWLS